MFHMHLNILLLVQFLSQFNETLRAPCSIHICLLLQTGCTMRRYPYTLECAWLQQRGKWCWYCHEWVLLKAQVVEMSRTSAIKMQTTCLTYIAEILWHAENMITTNPFKTPDWPAHFSANSISKQIQHYIEKEIMQCLHHDACSDFPNTICSTAGEPNKSNSLLNVYWTIKNKQTLHILRALAVALFQWNNQPANLNLYQLSDQTWKHATLNIQNASSVLIVWLTNTLVSKNLCLHHRLWSSSSLLKGDGHATHSACSQPKIWGSLPLSNPIPCFVRHLPILWFHVGCFLPCLAQVDG